MSGGVLTANGPSTASPAQTPSKQATPTPKSAPPPARRKPTTENWDDDFEFSFPPKPKRGPPPPRREGLVGLGLGIGIEGARGNAGAGTAPKGSPDSFDDEDWDDPLPGPSRLAHASSSSSISSPVKQRAPLQLNGIHLHPPRSSHSHSPTLPSPTAASGQASRRASPMPPLSLSGSPSVHTPRNSASGSTTPRGHLSKRSSTSFVPVRGESADAPSPLSSHGRSPAAASSPNLVGHRPQQFSRDSDFRRVPVPPLPTNIGLGHPSSPSKMSTTSPKHALSSPTKGQRSPTKRPSSPSKRQFPSSANPANAKTPELNSSPSTDSLKRPKFWKRFSHGPAAVEAGTASPTRRPRSTSVGNLTPQMSTSPPVPPLPPNMRSPSTTSAYSSSSAVSSTPSSHKSVTARRLSAMLRRSSSSLFGQLRESPPPPDIPVPTPPRHPYAIANGSSVNVAGMTFELMSSSNVNLPAMSSPNLLSTPPGNAMSSPSPLMPSSRHTRAVPSSSSSLHRASPSRRVSPSSSAALGMAKGTFSPGFHLPSPAAGSPYRQRAGAPSLTSVHNSPLAKDDLSSSDTETEEGVPTAPPTRRRVRPTSAMPPPREDVASNGSWKEVNASEPNLSPVNQTIRLPAVSRMEKEASGTFSITSDSSDHGFAASTQSTLRRITSLTRKHGRRLSGGWKFGSASSNSSTESASRPPIPVSHTLGHALETVAGSPSKVLFEEPGAHSVSDTATTPKQKRPTASSKTETVAEGKTPTPPENDKDTWSNSTAKARTKERRRMSFGDFAIPDDVLAKQKDLKRNINAVKKFAGGVEALKQLMVSHERVCDHILHKGTGEDTRHFVALENEYSQWWEMATVLIEVGSTGTEGATPTPQSAGPSSASESNSVRTRRITLATQDARAASEALRNFSGMTQGSLASRKTSGGMTTDSEVDVFNAFGPPRKLQPDHYRASTGRADLSKRQLEVLRTMLQTPVEASDLVVPSVDHKQASALFVDVPAPKKKVRDPTQRKSMPAVPTNIRRQLAAIDEPSPPCPEAMGFVMPTNYPSPETAAALAQPRPRSGLAGLRDFLRALKKPPHPPQPKPGKITKPKPSSRHRPPPINTEAAEKWHSPPGSPLPPAAHEDVLIQTHKGAATSPVKTTRKRPNIRHIFRPGSGNWADLVRSPPASPLVDSHSPHSSDRPARGSDEADSGGDQPPTPGPPQRPTASRQNSNASTALSRPPSLPALARLKMSKQSGYANLGVDSPNASPTRRGAESMPPLPTTPPLPPAPTDSTASTDNEATLRLKSRVLGLGHPSESSPSRASSSPARPVPTIELASTEDLTPRSRSDTAARVGARDDIVIALTPENLPVLLDYVRQCERKLDEWRARAVTLHGDNVL